MHHLRGHFAIQAAHQWTQFEKLKLLLFKQQLLSAQHLVRGGHSHLLRLKRLLPSKFAQHGVTKDDLWTCLQVFLLQKPDAALQQISPSAASAEDQSQQLQA